MRKRRRGRGEGGVEQLPSGSWRAVTPSRLDPKTGTRVRDTKTFDEKPDALAWLAEQTARPKAAVSGTFGEWLDVWLQGQERGTSPATYATTKQLVDKHIRPALGAVKLRDLDKDATAAFFLSLPPTQKRQAHAIGSTLRNCLNAAVEAGRLGKSPLGRKSLPKKPDTEAVPLTPKQLAEVLKLADASPLDGGRLGAMIRVWVDAALRPSEVLGLQWGDYDPATGTLKVRRSIDRHTGEIKATKTRKSRRTLPLSDPTRAALDAIRPADVSDSDTSPIFGGRKRRASATGHRRYRNFSRDVWEKFHATFPAALSWVVPYTFRHTAASLLLSAGVNVKVVSERLGHSDVALTLRTYAHVMPGDQERATAVMGTLLPTPRPTTTQKP